MAYNIEDTADLRALQLVELEIMKIFVDICARHRLRYAMIGGTMLGAVRHKGFITWDDDIDVGMPRADYERFLEIVRAELPEGYDFLNYKQNPDYLRYFSRIVDTRVEVTNASYTNKLVEHAWIDIFPLDGMPRTHVGRLFHFWHMTAWKFFYHASCFDQLVNLNRAGRPLYQRMLIRFMQVTKIGAKMDTKKLMARIERLLTKYDCDRCEYGISLFGAYMLKEIMPKSVFGDGALYPFEDSMFCGPADYDRFLTLLYGDYMTPPQDKNKHTIEKIEIQRDEIGA